MTWRPLSLTLLLAAVSSAVPAIAASTAKLYEPLPANSLERNGAPEPMAESNKAHRPPPAALPDTGPHPHAKAGLDRVYSGTPVDVLTYHNDQLRTGWNQSETDLTPATVASAGFGQLTTLNVDSNVIAQPLMISNFGMPDGSTHNILLIATGKNTVYAYDAQTYAVLWQVNLGTPQASGDVACSNIFPEYGISSTPVVVRGGPNAATIYLVAATEPAPFSFHTQLHALDLRTGQDLVPPVELAPKAKLHDGTRLTFDPQHQWNRTGLAFANNSIYVGIGSHCDKNATVISGWLLRYDPNLAPLHAFHTIEASASSQLASIWMTGFAPAVDANGNVLVVTGNGPFNTAPFLREYGETVLSLSPDLMKIVGKFTPVGYQTLNQRDADFGSGGVMLLPGVTGQKAPPLAVTMGKNAVLYLLNQNALGGLEGSGKGPFQQLQVGVPDGSGHFRGVWGGPAYYGSPTGGLVYYQTGSDVLRAYKVNTARPPSVADVFDGTSVGGFGGSLPIVSSNGATANTGVVWLIKRGITVQLEAYDALKLGDPLFAANGGNWHQGYGNAFLSPLVANGRVYVPAYKTVMVFGLTN